jgi:cell division septation protein DedD
MTTPMLRQAAAGGGASPLLIVLLLIIVLGGGAFALNYFGIVHLWGKKTKVVTESMPAPAQVTVPNQATTAPASKPPQTTTTTSKPVTTPDITPTPAMTQPPATTFKPPTTTKSQASTTPTTKPQSTAPSSITPTPSLTPTTSLSPTEKPVIEKPKPAMSSSAAGNYVVQVSSWVDVSHAKAEVDKLAAAGYSAFVEDAMVNGQMWHRVRVGRYSSEKEAADAASQLQQTYTDAWVVRTGSR